MADWASLNGSRIVTARISIPAYGAWTADVLVATDTTLSTTSSIVVGDLQLSGFAVRQGPYAGAWSARIVGGRGGWRRIIPAQGYNSAAGISRSLLLKDAAALVGESVVVGNDSIIGTLFTREFAPASRLLHQIAGSLWYIDFNGITQVGVARTSTAIKSDFQVLDSDPSKGLHQISTETLNDWTPGRTFTAPTVTTPVTIASVTHVLTDGGHRTDVLSVDASATAQVGEPTTSDRTMRALREIIRAEIPQLTFFGLWEYVVQSATTSTVDAIPVDSSGAFPLPEIVAAPLLPSVLGENVTFTVGSTCVIAFLNGDPSRPVVIGGDYETGPVLTKIAHGTLASARQTDAVTAGPFAGVITGGSTKVLVG